MNFSRRYSYAPNAQHEEILEDAPSWLRKAYELQVLDDFVNYLPSSPIKNCFLTSSGLKWDLIVHLRLFAEDENADSFIYQFLNNCEWYHFYDFVEFIAAKLIEYESSLEYSFFNEELITRFGFSAYREKVDELFADANVGWRMNELGSLRRQSSKSLDSKLQVIQNQLSDEFEPAREHYRKAIRYINERPLDPENSIKEIISAIESVGRIMFPSTKTLGDVIKEMRKNDSVLRHLVTVIEKFYAYACDEPAVRHGAPITSRVLLDDAEFSLHLGAALIRYLIALRGR
ncbi:MAG TPA: hypothetical protein PKE45_10770 [Caldilineaceae bacterium]|nr:hypothetical protein [Caldilineaceae bacterium]